VRSNCFDSLDAGPLMFGVATDYGNRGAEPSELHRNRAA